MDPRAAQTWNFAIDKFKRACEFAKQGNDEHAKTELVKAVYVGAGAIYYIHGKGPQDAKAYDAAQSYVAEMAAHQPEITEAIEIAKQVLNFIAQLAGPENHLPAV